MDMCARCHSDIYDNYILTRHYRAFSALSSEENRKNHECLMCHTTGFGEFGGYDPERERSRGVNLRGVQCEACHGPGSEHNKWATIDSLRRPKTDNYRLVVQTSNITSQQLVNQCAYCHARRTSFGDFVHPHDEVFDIMSPQLPIDPFYLSWKAREYDFTTRFIQLAGEVNIFMPL